MQKRQALLRFMCAAALGVCVFTACSNGESVGNGGSSTPGQEVQEDLSGGKSEEHKLSGKYEDYWFASLISTGEKAKPYPFSRLGTMDGYLPGMLPEELIKEGFSHFYPRGDSSGVVEVTPATYEELKTLTDIGTIGVYYDTINWEGKPAKGELVEYSIRNPEEGEENYTVEQAFADGNYMVTVKPSTGGGMDGSFLGLDTHISGTELANTLIEEWGMPSCIWLPWGGKEGDYISAYLCYEYDDYIVYVRTMGDDAGNVSLLAIGVVAYNDIDEWFRELGKAGSSVAVKWEP